MDLVILYAPYLPYYLSQVNQILQEETIYSEVVQRQVIFEILKKKMSKKCIFPILDLVILYAPYLPYYLSQVNQILQEERIYNEVVQRQVFFWFYCQKMSKIMHFLSHKCIFYNFWT